MNTVKELEKAIASLPGAELKVFRAWFAEFHASNWGAQIENDIEAGKLDSMGANALQRHKDGQAKEM